MTCYWYYWSALFGDCLESQVRLTFGTSKQCWVLLKAVRTPEVEHKVFLPGCDVIETSMIICAFKVVSLGVTLTRSGVVMISVVSLTGSRMTSEETSLQGTTREGLSWLS